MSGRTKAPASSGERTNVADAPSLTDTEDFTRRWELVQSELGDVPGERGALLRAERYAPFFLRFGEGVYISAGCRFHHPQRIALEADARFNEHALVFGSGGVRIGRHARIGPRLFLHSANHEITPSPLAFHERSYEYASVQIGDNCLLSANVSILPGVELSAGTFVAAGSVVTARHYQPDARLAGVPAREMTTVTTATATVPAPTVVVIGPTGEVRTEAMRQIVAALGFPQVAMAAPSAALPTTVRHILDLRADPPKSRPGLMTWSLEEGVVKPAARITIETAANDRVGFAGNRSFSTAPARGSPCAVLDAATITLYNAFKRRRKRKPEARDDIDLLLAGLILARAGSGEWSNGVWNRLIELLGSHDRGAGDALEALRGGAGDLRVIGEAIVQRTRISDAVRAKLEAPGARDLGARTIAAAPELLPALACLADGPRNEANLASAKALVSSADKAWSLACAGGFAIINNQADLRASVMDRLLGLEMFDSEAGCVRSAGSASSGYSYLVSIGVLLAVHAESIRSPGELPFTLTLERTETAPIRLGVVEVGGSGPAWIADRGSLACPTRRVISSGLVDEWIAAMTAPRINDAQLELSDAAYEPVVPALVRAWWAIFRHMIHAAGEPLIEVLPWPNGRSAAVSLRYDIDRATQPGHVRRIVEIQQRSFGGPCGSWYAIPGTLHGTSIQGTLRQHFQELAVHGVRGDHAEAKGLGMTMHSAPGSEYWRGEVTINAQANAGAAYAEFLSALFDRPQPAWLGASSGKPKQSDLWITPLHFPLEGSTNDTDLSYFDRLSDHFRAVLNRGGHAIIGSHPDLSQEVLSTLAERESLGELWCATVAEVVERCQSLFAPGALTLVTVDGSAVPHLLGLRTTSDVALRIEHRGEAPTVTVIQINRGQPRPLPPD